MRCVLGGLLSIVVCVFLAGCTSEAEKKDTNKAAENKGGGDKDEHGHEKNGDHATHDHEDDDHKDHKNDEHAASEEPLVIVPEIVAASDGHVKEVFANEHARVLAFDMHKGDKLPLHKIGPHAVFAVTDLELTVTYTHGGDHTHDDALKLSAGKVGGQGPGTFGFANAADAEAEFVMFVRKESEAFKASLPADAKSITDATKYATLLLRGSDDFRVYKVALPPGEKTEQHFALNRLVYALDDATVTFTDSAGKADAKELKNGEVYFHAAGSGTLENSGEAIAKFLVIEMKR